MFQIQTNSDWKVGGMYTKIFSDNNVIQKLMVYRLLMLKKMSDHLHNLSVNSIMQMRQ